MVSRASSMPVPFTVHDSVAGAFWGRWVLANAGGELAGLGSAGLAGWMLFSSMGEQETLLQHILVVLTMIAAGTFEGAVVGAAQAWALAPRLPDLSRWDWLKATALGALVAWALGMLPSTLMAAGAAGAQTSGQAPPEMGAAVRYGLAAVMGLVLGPILAVFQWRVLRRHLDRAGGWIPANAVAWALGMPVVFFGAHFAAGDASTSARIGIIAATLGAAGAVVGAVHGLWLVWRLPEASAQPERIQRGS